jgi:hypothetical protein
VVSDERAHTCECTPYWDAALILGAQSEVLVRAAGCERLPSPSSFTVTFGHGGQPGKLDRYVGRDNSPAVDKRRRAHSRGHFCGGCFSQ